MERIPAGSLSSPRLYKRDTPRRIDGLIEFFGEPAFPGTLPVADSPTGRGWPGAEACDPVVRREA